MTLRQPIVFHWDDETEEIIFGWGRKHQFKSRGEQARQAASAFVWGFSLGDYDALARLVHAHQLVMKSKRIEFGRVCACARNILGGDLALIEKTAERLELLPSSQTYLPRTLEAVATDLAGKPLSEALELALINVREWEAMRDEDDDDWTADVKL